LTTYDRFVASAACATDPVAGAAEAAEGRKPSEAVRDSTTGTASARRLLERIERLEGLERGWDMGSPHHPETKPARDTGVARAGT
jgi:hypothetical protein